MRLAAAGALLVLPGMGVAQVPRAWLDGSGDLRERGLSLSGGRAGVEAGIAVGSPGALLELAAATTRGAVRHGSADLRVAATAGFAVRAGGSRLRGDVTWRGFAGGRGPLNYWEAGAVADTLVGPVTLAASLRYAPPQRALGGSLLYARIGAEGGLPGTPWSLAAHLGRTGGATRDPLLAARLRPDPTYLDWAISLRRTIGPATLSLTYSDTDVARDRPGLPQALRAHAGAVLVARVGFDF